MLNRQNPIIALVVPCYNEETGLEHTIKKLNKKLDQLKDMKQVARESFLFFVDDGSRDQTWSIIETASLHSDSVNACKLSRNFGHQYAVLAGINCCSAKADAIISIDADLQQDIEALDYFIASYKNGNEIVLGVRNDRKTDSKFKAFTANCFYSLMQICGVSILRNHADYRLLGRKAVDALLSHPETDIFLRAQCLNLGFPKDIVYFDVKERIAGESKYTLIKMISMSLTGITSFSYLPLRAIAILGFIVFLCTLIMAMYVFGAYFLFDDAVPGWASTVLPIYFLGGVQIMCLGIMSEYLAKVYKETKKRPPYIIEKEI